MKAIFSILSEPGQTENDHLSIQWSPDQISFLIYEKQPSKIKFLSVYPIEAGLDSEQLANNIKSCIESDRNYNRQFQTVNLYYDTASFILVPTPYYNADTRADMLSLQFGEMSGIISFSDFIPSSDMVNIFRVPEPIHRSLMVFYPMAKISHASSEILSLAKPEGHLLQVEISRKICKVYFYANGKLKLHQHFSYATPEDVAYHCLNICSQMQVPANDCRVELSGFVEGDSALYKTLHKYFLHIGFMEPSPDLQVGTGFESYPEHLFYPITRKALCE